LEGDKYERTLKVLSLAEQEDHTVLESEFYIEAAVRMDSSSSDVRGVLTVRRSRHFVSTQTEGIAT
jgi:hypothetical protein